MRMRRITFGAVIAVTLLTGSSLGVAVQAAPAGASGIDPGDRSTPQPFALPAGLPDDARSGRIETPLGPATWIRRSGDRETLPLLPRALAVPGGWAGVESGEPDEPARLWFSPDHLRWSERPLPVPATSAILTGSDDRFWLTTSDDSRVGADGVAPGGSPGLWTSRDAAVWEPIDLSAIEAPEPADVDWVSHLGHVVQADDFAVVPISHEVRSLSALLGLPSESADLEAQGVGLEPVGDGTYEVRVARPEPLATVRFEETDGGVRVIDASDGVELTTIDSIGLETIERWAETGVSVDRLGIIDGDQVSGIGSWPEMPPARFRYLTSDDGELVVVAQIGDGLFQTWRSRDARTWHEGPVIGDDPEEPGGLWGMGLRDGTWIAYGGRGDREVVWGSDDGVTWTSGDPIRHGGPKVRLGSYWLTLDVDRPRFIEFHPDGNGKTRRVDARRLRLDSVDDDWLGWQPLGDHALILTGLASRDDRRPIRHWIIRFDDPIE